MNEIGKTVADVTMKASIVTGSATSAGSYFDWIGTNAAALGVLISFTGVIITGIYYFMMARKQNLKDNNSDRLNNLEEESKRTNTKLNLILDKLE